MAFSANLAHLLTLVCIAFLSSPRFPRIGQGSRGNVQSCIGVAPFPQIPDLVATDIRRVSPEEHFNRQP